MYDLTIAASLLPQAVVLLVVAFHRLHGVTQRPGGDEHEDHDHQGIHREAAQAGEAESPHRAHETREYGDDDALHGAEVQEQKKDDGDCRREEEDPHRRQRLLEVGEQDGWAGDVDLDLAVGLLAFDDLPYLCPHSGEVEVFLPESGDDLRRPVVVAKRRSRAHLPSCRPCAGRTRGPPGLAAGAGRSAAPSSSRRRSSWWSSASGG